MEEIQELLADLKKRYHNSIERFNSDSSKFDQYLVKSLNLYNQSIQKILNKKKDDDVIRIMTFNVHTFENPATTIKSLNKLVKEHKLDGEIYTQEKIANLIKVLNVDFLALQKYTTPYNENEGKVDSKQFLNLLDNQYYQINSWLGKTNQEIKLKIGNAIFIKKNNKNLNINLNNIHLFHISKNDKVYRDFLGYKFNYNNEEFYLFNPTPSSKMVFKQNWSL